MDKVRDAFYAWKSVDNNYVYVDVDANSLETFKAGAAWQAEQLIPKDKPTECANGCPVNQVCDYCQRGGASAMWLRWALTMIKRDSPQVVSSWQFEQASKVADSITPHSPTDTQPQ